MKASNSLWKSKLQGHIAEPLATELDVYENEIALRKHGKIEDRIFAETRLRRGSYGQRYDNGQRSDGEATRTLPYPDVPTKGPGTMWDAPGMQRIKIPYGGLNASQLETLAALCEEYSDGIAHITTREACGNTVRNGTSCPIAGVCRTQTFDVTPYAKAAAYFMLGHPDSQAY